MAVFKFRNLKNGQAMPIPPGEFLVGRADEAYIHLEDPSVSRRHAQVINNDSGFFVEDLGSANGTATRGAFITRRMHLNFGDVVHIGSVPFRVDPEIEGEVEVASSVRTRMHNSAYMRRDTERLPPSGELPRVVEQLSPEKLSAPEISPDGDIDADDLNAVTMSEPVQPTAPTKPEPEPVSPAQRPPQPQLYQPGKAFSIQVEAHQPPATAPAQPSQATPPSRTTVGWGWFLVIFLAGLGVGLLLGLCFARIFIEMGGRAASLP